MKKNRRRRHQNRLTLLLFVSASAAAILGDNVPALMPFAQSFPVFAEFGNTLQEEGLLAAFPIAQTEQTATPTKILPPSPTNTFAFTPTISPTTKPSETPSPTITSEPSKTPTSFSGICPGTLPSRLYPGEQARLMRNLNLRSSPKINSSNLIRTNIKGTTLEILGNPQCSNSNDVSYMWWQVRTNDGLIGWSTEISANGTFYFMEPIK